jgi:hypothetical protein
MEDLRDRPDQQRLGQPRRPGDQAVPAGEQADQQLLHHLPLADDRLAVGEHAAHFVRQVVPLVLAPEVVHHQEAAVEEIPPQAANFVVGEQHPPRLDEVDEGVVEQLRVGQLQHLVVGIDPHRSELLQAEGEIEIAVGKVGRPAAAPAVIARAVADPHKGEDVFLEVLVLLPVGHAAAVVGIDPAAASSPALRPRLAERRHEHGN